MAFDVFEMYATDETAEVEGVEMSIGDAKFLIARSGNKNFSKKLSKLYTKHQRVLERKDDVSDKLSDSVMVECIAETILLGWEGVSFKGKELPYSVDNAKMLLEFKDFRKQIMGLAEDFDSYKSVKEAEEEKN
jgi:hypothetical protein